LLKIEFPEIVSAMATKRPRYTFNVALYPPEKKRVTDFCLDRGMKKTVFMERLLRWFAAQPADVQDGIVYPSRAPDRPLKVTEEEGDDDDLSPGAEDQTAEPPATSDRGDAGKRGSKPRAKRRPSNSH
jgi:hypothetical protein